MVNDNDFLFVGNRVDKSEACERFLKGKCSKCSHWKRIDKYNGLCGKYNMYSKSCQTCKSYDGDKK